MESSKLEASEFKTMLTNALREAIDPKDLPSDPKRIKELAKKIVSITITDLKK